LGGFNRDGLIAGLSKLCDSQHKPRKSTKMKLKQSICLTTALLFLAITGSTTRAEGPAANLAGNWKWVAPANPDGRIPGITFTLKLQGETLTGTVNKTSSREAITNGVVKGDEVSFQTVVQKKSGKAGIATTTYSGKISGDTIKGTMKIEVGDREIGPIDWEADRVKK
jgi:hypothetical protein